MMKLSFVKRSILAIILFCLVGLLLFSLFLPVIFTLVIVNFFLLYVMVLFLLVHLDKKDFGKAKYPKRFGSVTVLVPVYNSMGTIQNCMKHIKAIKYPGKLELVFVDDGSTDGSRDFLEKQKGIRLIKLKKNSGKAIALNTALKTIKTEFVACMDSDTYPEENVLLKTLGYFEEEKVGAVTCLILPDKKGSLLHRIQFFEYATSFGLWCTILSYIDSMSMIPGPMTVFKRKVFDVVGDYDPNNLTEDMDIGLRLQEHGFKIRTCYEAVALTDVPDTWKKLFKQRDRWYRGRIFNLMIHNNLFFNKENKSLGFFSIPYLFSLELISMVLLVRLAILFLNNALTMIASEVIAFSATNAVFVTIPHFFMTSTAIFFFFSYFFVFLYIYFSLKTVNYKPDFFDIIVILINILLYPFFITIVYGQGFFKELFGVRAKWVRVST